MATVDELALLSKSVYGGSNETIPQGWTQISIGSDNNKYFEDTFYNNGFAGALYGHVIGNDEDGKNIYDEVVMAIRGTEPTSITDLNNDLAIMKGEGVEQEKSLGAYLDAVNKALEDNNITPTKKYITGQSLGGTLAQLLNVEFMPAVETVTFDAFGAKYITNLSSSTITNYVVANDPVGTYYFDGHIGNVVLLYPVPMDDSALSALYPHNYIPFYNDLSISNFIIPNGAANWSKEQGLALWFYDKNMNDASTNAAIEAGFTKPPLSVLESAVTYIESLNIHPVTLTYDAGDGLGGKGYYIIGDMTGAETAVLTGKTDNSLFFNDNYNDTIYGNGGNDVINGLGGNDTIYGGDGADTVHGGDGNDLIYGFENKAGASETLTGTTGNYLYGEAGNDAIWGGGAGSDYLDGGSGNDIIHATGNNSSVINGGADSDTLYGADSNDLIYGGSGADEIHGGDGADIIYANKLVNSTDDGKNDIYGDFSRLSRLKGA